MTMMNNNGQNYSQSQGSSAPRGNYMNMMCQGVGGGIASNKGGPANSSWNEHRMPPSYRGGNNSNNNNMRNDAESQPMNNDTNPMYNNFGRYNPNNYSNPPGRNNGMGMGSYQGNDEGINYLAARAHAAQMLAAEESRRLEENLMMLEMRRRMMVGGASSGRMDGGENGMNGNQFQTSSSNTSSGTRSQGNDSILMARAQKFNIPQSQMNMMDRRSSSNDSPHLAMGMNMSWNNTGNANRSFMQMQRPNPNNDPPSFAPPKSGEAIKSPGGEAVAGQASQPCQDTTAQADAAPKKIKTPDAPRRPLSAYNIFFSEMRETILKEHEDKDETDSKEEGGDSSTQPGKGNAKKSPDKEKVEEPKDMEAFTQKLMRKRLDKKPAKRVHRKSHGKVAFTTLARTVGQRWRVLPEEEKKKYKDLAEIDRTRYRNEKLVMGKVLKEEAKQQRKEAKARLNNAPT